MGKWNELLNKMTNPDYQKRISMSQAYLKMLKFKSDWYKINT